jgi:serine/threonine protein kinase
MEGGRFLGSGSFGCAFTPPLVCKSKKKQKRDQVGKITLGISANQEITIANRIRQFPMAKNYFLLPDPESCDLAPKDAQTDPGLGQCVPLTRTNSRRIEYKDMKQIFMPFGGTKILFDVFSNTDLHPDRFDFFGFMQHMLEAGTLLLLARVSHFDLHPGNIIFDQNKTARILDFGISFVGDTVTESIIEGRARNVKFGFEPDAAYSEIHNSEPPELTTMNAVFHGGYSPREAIDLTLYGKKIFRQMESILSYPMTISQKELGLFWEQSSFAQKRDEVRFWRTYWPGFDAWSIGCLLLETLQKLLVWPAFTSGVYAKRRTIVGTCLRGLLHPNPKKRLDCAEVLSIYDPTNPILERYGKQWLQSRKAQRQRKFEGKAA